MQWHPFPKHVPQDPIRRYSNTAVALHWVTVVIVLTQVVLGFAFAEFMAKGPARSEVFAWHKTLGVLILVCTDSFEATASPTRRLRFRPNCPAGGASQQCGTIVHSISC